MNNEIFSCIHNTLLIHGMMLTHPKLLKALHNFFKCIAFPLTQSPITNSFNVDLMVCRNQLRLNQTLSISPMEIMRKTILYAVSGCEQTQQPRFQGDFIKVLHPILSYR